MGLIQVDPEKCIKDELCVTVCPSAIIRMNKKTGFPDMIPRADKGCIRCGHCVAVCPVGALTHTEIPLEDCAPLRKEAAVTQEQVVQLLRSRRSIRRFKQQPVEKKDIAQVIQTARYAPSAGNIQPIEWIVISREQDVRHLADLTVAHMRHAIENHDPSTYAPYWPALVAAWDKGMDVVLRSAPAVVIAASSPSKDHGMTDVTLALTYFELAAMPLGLGTCWAGLLHAAMMADETFAEEIPVLKTHPHHYPLMVGYKDIRYQRMPERNPPKIHWFEMT